MKKKNLALVLGAALIATMLVGCGAEQETAAEQSTEVAQEPVAEQPEITEEVTVVDGTKFDFAATDIDGNYVSLADFPDAKLIMVNFWEPWCGPCVNEMPDIEKLYEEYSSDGFVVLGVFSTQDADDDVRAVMNACGTTYPILRYESNMEPFITDYVPTTVFIDKEGNVLTSEPIIGGNSYEDWKGIIDQYMNR